MRETAHVLALLGGADRRGAWAPADRVRVVAIMGGAKLDLREAELLEGETEITVFALMGGVQILVPDDVHVEADGIGLMGASARPTTAPTTPTRRGCACAASPSWAGSS